MSNSGGEGHIMNIGYTICKRVVGGIQDTKILFIVLWVFALNDMIIFSRQSSKTPYLLDELLIVSSQNQHLCSNIYISQYLCL